MPALETPRIVIEDLPALELLSEEEMAHIFGAGSVRPSFEALEDRQLLSASLGHIFAPPRINHRVLEAASLVQTSPPTWEIVNAATGTTTAYELLASGQLLRNQGAGFLPFAEDVEAITGQVDTKQRAAIFALFKSGEVDEFSSAGKTLLQSPGNGGMVASNGSIWFLGADNQTVYQVGSSGFHATYTMPQPIATKWLSLGGPDSNLGLPSGASGTLPGVAGGMYQQFHGGALACVGSSVFVAPGANTWNQVASSTLTRTGHLVVLFHDGSLYDADGTHMALIGQMSSIAPDDVASMAVDGAGSLYCLSFANRTIWQHVGGMDLGGLPAQANSQRDSWQSISSNDVASMAVDATGTLYSLSFVNHTVWQHVSGYTWKPISSNDVANIVVDGTGTLYSLSFANHTTWQHLSANNWQPISSNDVASMAVDRTGALFSLSFANHTIWQHLNANHWQAISSNDVSSIVVDRTGTLFALSTAKHTAWQHLGANNWQPVSDQTIAAALNNLNHNATDVAGVMKNVFGDTDSLTATMLDNLKYTPADIATALKTVFGDSDSVTAGILGKLGVSTSNLVTALQNAFSDSYQTIAAILNAQGTNLTAIITGLNDAGADAGTINAAVHGFLGDVASVAQFGPQTILYLMLDRTIYMAQAGKPATVFATGFTGLAPFGENHVLILDHDHVTYYLTPGHEPEHLSEIGINLGGPSNALLQFGANQALFLLKDGTLLSLSVGGQPVTQAQGVQSVVLFGDNQVLYLQNGTMYSWTAGSKPVYETSNVQSLSQFGFGQALYTLQNGTIYSWVAGQAPTSQLAGAKSVVGVGNGQVLFLLPNGNLYSWATGGQPTFQAAGVQTLVSLGGNSGYYVLQNGDVYTWTLAGKPSQIGQNALIQADGSFWYLSSVADYNGDHSAYHIANGRMDSAYAGYAMSVASFNKWMALGGPSSSLGSPTETVNIQTGNNGNGFTWQPFTNGYMYTLAGNADPQVYVGLPIVDRFTTNFWFSLGGPTSVVGSPTPHYGSQSGQNEWSWQEFTKGAIYNQSINAGIMTYTISGPIWAAYQAQNQSLGFLGFPTGNVAAQPGVGQCQRFTGGFIYQASGARPDVLLNKNSVTAADGSIWYLGSSIVGPAGDFSIYRVSNGQVNQMAGFANLLRMASDGKVWVCTATGTAYRWNGSQWALEPALLFPGGAPPKSGGLFLDDGSPLDQLMGFGKQLIENGDFSYDGIVDQLAQAGEDALENFAEQLIEDATSFVFSDQSNQQDVRGQIANAQGGGWVVVYGTMIGDDEYVKCGSALAASVITEQPELFTSYFGDLIKRNIAKMKAALPGAVESYLEDTLMKVISGDGSITKRMGDLEFKGGIATYNRTATILGSDGNPLPNWHQAYLAFRFYQPGTDTILQPTSATPPGVIDAQAPAEPTVQLMSLALANKSQEAKTLSFRWGPDYPWEDYYLAPNEVKVLTMKYVPFVDHTQLAPEVSITHYTVFPNGGTAAEDERYFFTDKTGKHAGYEFVTVRVSQLTNATAVAQAANFTTIVNPFTQPDWGLSYNVGTATNLWVFT